MDEMIKDPKIWAVAAAAVWEVVLRIIPTVKDYTIVGKIIKALKWLSDELNNSKETKRTRK